MGNDNSAELAEAQREHEANMAKAASEAEQKRLQMEFDKAVAIAKQEFEERKLEREARQEEARLKLQAEQETARLQREADQEAARLQREADKEEKEAAREERKAERAAAEKALQIQAAQQQKQFEAEQAEKKAQREAEQEEKRQEREMRRAEAERKAALEKEKQEQEHQQELKRLEQEMRSQKIEERKAARDECRAKVESLDEKIEKETEQLEKATVDLEATSADLTVQRKVLDEWHTTSQLKIAAVAEERGLSKAKDAYDQGEKEIEQAIAKTGQQEGNVGRFLHLTHGLVGATLATTTQSNKLEAEMSTFNELISRECSDKLTIEQYFGEDEHLKPLTPLLLAQGMSYMETLKCEDEKEFDAIKKIVEDGLQKEVEAKKANAEKAGAEEADAKEEAAEPTPEELLKNWNLSEFWEPFKEEGYDDSVEDWKDLQKEDFADMGIKRQGKIKQFIRKLKDYLDNLDDGSLMTPAQKRCINQVCLKSETWQPFAEARVRASKRGLDVVSILLADFFSEMNKGVKESQKLITYGDSDKAQESIEAVKALPPPAIEHPATKDGEADAEDPEKEARWKWEVGAKCEIYSDSNKAWMAGEITEIEVTEDDGEWLHIQYEGAKKRIGRLSSWVRPLVDDKDDATKLAVQTKALSMTAIANINVTSSMMDRFKENPTSERALTVAEGVEGCCQQIISSQCTIRQSVMLAAQILDMKPASMSADTKPLWDAVDAANVHIFETAIDMTRACAEYFGYFLRFKSSFLHYQSNRDEPLMISLEHLRKDCKEFAEFRGEFEATVDKLNKQALDCITNCVKSNVGASNFERAMQLREEARSKYLKIKAEVDRKAVELENAHDVKQQEVVVLMAKVAGLEQRVSTLKASIELKEKNKAEYSERELQLTNTLKE